MAPEGSFHVKFLKWTHTCGTARVDSYGVFYLVPCETGRLALLLFQGLITPGIISSPPPHHWNFTPGAWVSSLLQVGVFFVKVLAVNPLWTRGASVFSSVLSSVLTSWMYLGGRFGAFRARRPKMGIEPLSPALWGHVKLLLLEKQPLSPVWPELVKPAHPAVLLRHWPWSPASFPSVVCCVCKTKKRALRSRYSLGGAGAERRNSQCVSFFENVEFACKFSLLPWCR